MQRTRVKICGVGYPEDAIAAAEAGADAIGMIFHPPSKRNVGLDRAMKITEALPPFVTPVGLFVDADAKQIRDTAQILGLRHIQLHGHESFETIADLREFVILKAVRVDAHFGRELERWASAIHQHKLTHLRGLVLETANTIGGSGMVNNWEAIERHRRQGDFRNLPGIIAAGGLTPENVESVVRQIRPWAVDVSSGVEEAPTRKSIQKMQAFINAVRVADRSRSDMTD